LLSNVFIIVKVVADVVEVAVNALGKYFCRLLVGADSSHENVVSNQKTVASVGLLGTIFYSLIIKAKALFLSYSTT